MERNVEGARAVPIERKEIIAKQNKRLMFSLHNCEDVAHFMSINFLKLLTVVGFDFLYMRKDFGGKKTEDLACSNPRNKGKI